RYWRCVMGKLSIVAVLAVSSALSACAIYREPAGVPEIDLVEPSMLPESASTLPDKRQWWVGFDDPLLNNLVAEAMRQNTTVRAALANVNAARALRGLQRW